MYLNEYIHLKTGWANVSEKTTLNGFRIVFYIGKYRPVKIQPEFSGYIKIVSKILGQARI